MKLLIWLTGAITFAMLCAACGIGEVAGTVLGVGWGYATALLLLMWERP